LLGKASLASANVYADTQNVESAKFGLTALRCAISAAQPTRTFVRQPAGAGNSPYLMTHDPIVALGLFATGAFAAGLFSYVHDMKRQQYLLFWAGAWGFVALHDLSPALERWMAVAPWQAAINQWLLAAAAFVAGLFVNPPYGFAPEDNLAYAHVIRMHQAGIAQLKKLYPDATVLTAWPMSDELTRPELGYVKKPWDVFAIDDFTAGEIARAAAEPEKYSAALVFSTKYDPPPLLPSLSGEALDEHYFGLHHDLPPDLIAQHLGGTMVWERRDDGMWIALIRFNRQVEARLEKPAFSF